MELGHYVYDQIDLGSRQNVNLMVQLLGILVCLPCHHGLHADS